MVMESGAAGVKVAAAMAAKKTTAATAMVGA